MMDAAQLTQALAQFTGTEHHFYNPMFPEIRYTDGVQFLGKNGAGWLIDAISSRWPEAKRAIGQEFQLWELTVHPSKTATLVCRADTGEEPCVVQQIPWTDFPLPEITLYCEYGVILLPREH